MKTYTENEVDELMWRAARPWIGAGRWSAQFRRTQEPRMRMILKDIREQYVAQCAARTQEERDDG